MTVQPVRGADGEDQSPLLKKCAIGREERVASVVDTGRFRGSAVEFNDLEIASLFEIFFIFVADIVSPNEKAGEFTRNLIDRPLQFLRKKMHSIAENAALRMVAGLDQSQLFAGRQDFASAMSKSPQVDVRDQRCSRIPADQFLDHTNAVADNCREDFFGDGKYLAARFVWETEIKDSGFMPAGRVPLQNYWRVDFLQVIERVPP